MMYSQLMHAPLGEAYRRRVFLADIECSCRVQVPEIEKLNSRLLDARGRKGENVKRKAVEKARVQELKKELQGGCPPLYILVSIMQF